MSALNEQLAAMQKRKAADKPTPSKAKPSKAATTKHAPATGATAGSWEATHRRATFHLPADLLGALDLFCSTTGRSKSEVVRTALAAELNR